ncbi:dihydroorotase [Buchnera aphidicola (Hyadaphis tataricae)]|uniref:Dihydroorotase n=1 Tax=Buchnera aphidicola (Hyadaphis tataricae) TaxID=1241859 RepID=A0A4D6XUU5_9GAMM|nr:dihydroorotase [Buchnera aphidicola]QCI21632.1 dihydroorotase [Buchnera aphidicola (Hyadaphis tataricae)]
MTELKTITIIKPDDWHVHVRDGKILEKVIKYTAQFYKRAIIMPNLEDPITNCVKSLAYRNRILNSIKFNSTFQPLMTCYLTPFTTSKELEYGFYKKIFVAAKLYLKSSTTNSENGIKNINDINHILQCMEDISMPLLIHGEDNDKNIDIYDRESEFIKNILEPLRKKFSKLKIILEHITTKDAVEYVKKHDEQYLSATITPHHLMLNRNDMFLKGIQPHLYCLPILKKRTHQQALRQAVSNGDKHFFLGSDTAPHLNKNKIHCFGRPGIFNAPSSLLCYITVFEELNALKHFQAFCSENGPNFYNMPINTETVTLVKKPFKILNKINIGKKKIIPFLSGKTLHWSMKT